MRGSDEYEQGNVRVVMTSCTQSRHNLGTTARQSNPLYSLRGSYYRTVRREPPCRAKKVMGQTSRKRDLFMKFSISTS
eukprot:scaffold28300_cov59-Attheya_sp.AAC.4